MNTGRKRIDNEQKHWNLDLPEGEVVDRVQNIQIELKVAADNSDHPGHLLVVLKNYEGNILQLQFWFAFTPNNYANPA